MGHLHSTPRGDKWPDESVREPEDAGHQVDAQQKSVRFRFKIARPLLEHSAMSTIQIIGQMLKHYPHVQNSATPPEFISSAGDTQKCD